MRAARSRRLTSPTDAPRTGSFLPVVPLAWDHGDVGEALVRDAYGVEAAAILRLVPFEGRRVLDVGCGEGRLTRLAAARARFVFAFDPNAETVAEAQRSLTEEQRERVRFAVHGAEALEVPRERFDVALCGWSL